MTNQQPSILDPSARDHPHTNRDIQLYGNGVTTAHVCLLTLLRLWISIQLRHATHFVIRTMCRLASVWAGELRSAAPAEIN